MALETQPCAWARHARQVRKREEHDPTNAAAGCEKLEPVVQGCPVAACCNSPPSRAIEAVAPLSASGRYDVKGHAHGEESQNISRLFPGFARPERMKRGLTPPR
jgi:hypothetical protein